MANTEGAELQIHQLPLTDKEELAVVVERIKAKAERTKSVEAKVRLELAADLVRSATVWMPK
jgi:hypothetical protein